MLFLNQSTDTQILIVLASQTYERFSLQDRYSYFLQGFRSQYLYLYHQLLEDHKFLFSYLPLPSTQQSRIGDSSQFSLSLQDVKCFEANAAIHISRAGRGGRRSERRPSKAYSFPFFLTNYPYFPCPLYSYFIFYQTTIE